MTNQAIFRLQHAIGDFFREYLNGKGFIEIHSPKLQGSATESGASVFKVDYFKGEPFLPHLDLVINLVSKGMPTLHSPLS